MQVQLRSEVLGGFLVLMLKLCFGVSRYLVFWFKTTVTNTATGTLSSLWVNGFKKRRSAFRKVTKYPGRIRLCSAYGEFTKCYFNSLKVPALFGIDTRMLTKVIRDKVL